MDISIIIVNWNAKDFLSKCLASIRTQLKDIAYETIVIDNGSEDGSQEMITSKYPWVQLNETGNNLGFARANNIGMKQSKGRYICLVNSDIEFIENCISPMIEYLNDHSEVGIIGPKLLNIDLSTQNSFFQFPSLWNIAVRTFALDYFRSFLSSVGKDGNNPNENVVITSVDALSGAFLMIRREAYEKIGGFDDNLFMYSEDIDLSKRYHQGGWDIVYYPFTKVIHHGGGSSKNDPVKFYVEQQRARLYFSSKYYSLSKQISIRILMILYNFIRLIFWVMRYPVNSLNRNTSLYMINRYYSAIVFLMTPDSH